MTDHGQRGATERLRHGFFATILGVTGVVLSVLGFLAVRNPAAARLVASSDGVASLLTGLAFTAIACALVLHYGRRSAQLSAAYRELHRATLQRERSEAALRESERFTRATLDAIDAQIAVLDADGVVMAVNRAWRSRLHPLLGDTGACDVGSNYLFFCDGVRGERAREVARVAEAVREITAGEREECLIESVVPDDGSVLVTRVTRFASRGPLRLVVAHQDVSAFARAGTQASPEAPAFDAPTPTPAWRRSRPRITSPRSPTPRRSASSVRTAPGGSRTRMRDSSRWATSTPPPRSATAGSRWCTRTTSTASSRNGSASSTVARAARPRSGPSTPAAPSDPVASARSRPTTVSSPSSWTPSAAARADAVLARERDVYRHAIGLERSLVFATDAGGRIALANAAAAAFCGTTPADLVGRVAEHLAPDASSDGEVERFRDHAGIIPVVRGRAARRARARTAAASSRSRSPST
jgi:PAS domain-containing protein